PPACAASAGSAAPGALPLELTARVSPSGRCTRAKRSPPTPHMCGYATARTVAARSAASTALPPSSNRSAPARVASSCGEALAQVVPGGRRPVRLGRVGRGEGDDLAAAVALAEGAEAIDRTRMGELGPSEPGDEVPAPDGARFLHQLEDGIHRGEPAGGSLGERGL